MWCHRLVTSHSKVRRPPSVLSEVLLPPLVSPRNHQVCSEHFCQLKLYDTTWSQALCRLYDTKGNRMNSSLMKHTETDIEDLLLDYIDIPVI